MAYLSPAIVPSGTTFPQFQSGGFRGQLIRLANANAFSPAVRSLIVGNLNDLENGIVHVVDAFLRGDPITTTDINAKLLVYATALKAVATALDEVNLLIDSNPGTVATIASNNAAGHRKRRSFP